MKSRFKEFSLSSTDNKIAVWVRARMPDKVIVSCCQLYDNFLGVPLRVFVSYLEKSYNKKFIVRPVTNKSKDR